MSFGWPHIGSLTPLLFVGLVPLLWVEERIFQAKAKGSRQRLSPFTYLTFLTFNGITTWWVCHASLWGGIAAIVCNAAFMAGVWQLYHFTKRKVGRRESQFAFVLFWLAFEYIHLSWELTWPWLTFGNGLANSTALIQWYEYTGFLGGTIWILLVNLLVFEILRLWKAPEGAQKLSIQLCIALSLVVLIPIGVSLTQYSSHVEQGTPVDIVALQPNIDPYNEKFGSVSPEEQLGRMLELAAPLIDDKVDYLIGPETALPQTVWENHPHNTGTFTQLQNFSKKHPGLNVVIGMSSARIFEPDELRPIAARKFTKGDKYYEAYNTATQFDRNREPVFYHKSKLVPGVERMPYPSLFKFLGAFAIDLGGTSGSLGTQEERTVFFDPDQPELGVAPVICYESIFGEYVTEYVEKGAQLIFIVTNDGWWEDTPGYKQHLAYGRLRAIETRRSIARSANTGISCFINQRGDISQATNWWVPDAIRETILANEEQTFYVRYGEYLARTAVLVSALLLLLTIVRTFAPKERGLK